ncbi:MAG: segregation/condensation protein A [Deltaproteobacteria bacterium]|jgi:segregation and condensation protein A|nr:segregation/condensation protein A [Deltaproteobacteria bacterium]
MPEEITLKLDIYEGPLDLLLHLIRKNKVDINDIPLCLITAQYLQYLEQMEALNLDVAGDFLIMAATLTHIKAKMLLPFPSDSEGEPTIDPREELARPLIEYAAYQAAADNLAERPLLDRDVFNRGGSGTEFVGELSSLQTPLQSSEVASGSLFELMEAWNNIIGRVKIEQKALSFKIETKTIGQRLEEIRLFLLEIKTSHFVELIRSAANRFELALSFLAVLELARTGFLRLYQDLEQERRGPALFLADPGAKTSAAAELDYR